MNRPIEVLQEFGIRFFFYIEKDVKHYLKRNEEEN